MTTDQNILKTLIQQGGLLPKEDLLEAVPTARTVPQIFLGEELVGGFTELKQKLQSNEKFILDLYASWCGPCKVLSPILERVSSKLKESNSDVSVYKFNIEHDSELVSSLGVRAVPTLKFYSGGENKRTQTGMMSEQALIEAAQVL